jgi:hypothetical protein
VRGKEGMTSPSSTQVEACGGGQLSPPMSAPSGPARPGTAFDLGAAAAVAATIARPGDGPPLMPVLKLPPAAAAAIHSGGDCGDGGNGNSGGSGEDEDGGGGGEAQRPARLQRTEVPHHHHCCLLRGTGDAIGVHGGARGPAVIDDLPGALLATVARQLIAALRRDEGGSSTPVPAVVDRSVTSSVDWDYQPERPEEAAMGVWGRRAIRELCRLRRVARAWRSAIRYSLLDELHLNRQNHASRCWWPPRLMGHLSRASQMIRTAPLPPDFGARFAGLRALTLANLRMRLVPPELRTLSRLEKLNLVSKRRGLPPSFARPL